MLMPRIRSAAFVCAFLLGLALLTAPPARAIVGIEATMEYAIDAPWRIEPAAVVDGGPVSMARARGVGRRAGLRRHPDHHLDPRRRPHWSGSRLPGRGLEAGLHA